MSSSVKHEHEIAVIADGGQRLAEILCQIVRAVVPGVATADLDVLAEQLIRSCGGDPVFKGYRVQDAARAFPASICVSINDEVVHGIPRQTRVLREGDIVGIDIGMRWPAQGGFCTDTAMTIGVGTISPDAQALMDATRASLSAGIAAAKTGNHIGDIGHAVQRYLDACGYGVVRELAGHGVGYELHEEPLIPNYGKPGTGVELKPGMVLAIEPMATLGSPDIVLDDDEWTFRTRDGSLAAHFEQTIAITERGTDVLTPFE